MQTALVQMIETINQLIKKSRFHAKTVPHVLLTVAALLARRAMGVVYVLQLAATDSVIQLARTVQLAL